MRRTALAAACLAWSTPTFASPTLCDPAVLGETTVETTAQTVAAGSRISPPPPHGFDWNDTELGVVRSADGTHLLFLASDGSCHRDCNRPHERDGSITVTHGTLDNPLGTGAPREAIIGQSGARPGIVLPPSTLYAGGGAVYRVPAGHPAAGALLLIYQAARASYEPGHHYPNCDPNGICNVNQNGFYSSIGLAASRDEGATWHDFGIVTTVNQPYRPQLTVDIGNGNLLPDPPDSASPAYFRLYFPDRLRARGMPDGVGTRLSVARVPYDTLLDAVAHNATLPAFAKYHDGKWKEPGLGGVSTDLITEPSNLDGDMFVAWNETFHRYVGIFDNTAKIRYIESTDGLTWTKPVALPPDIKPLHDSALYATPVGTGTDPAILGTQFYIYYNYQQNGYGWGSTQLRRMQIGCQGTP